MSFAQASISGLQAAGGFLNSGKILNRVSTGAEGSQELRGPPGSMWEELAATFVVLGCTPGKDLSCAKA